LAVFNGLWLYLQDAVSQHPSVIQESNEPIFSALLGRLNWNSKYEARGRQAVTAPQIVEMGNFLVQHGFDPTRDPEGISTLMKQL
jgi:hypothetical protein